MFNHSRPPTRAILPRAAAPRTRTKVAALAAADQYAQAADDGTSMASSGAVNNIVTTPPCTTDRTSGGNPSNPSNPTTPGSPSDPAPLGNLAFTGLGTAGPVTAILALLAAGAYLVREGYRRNGRRQIP